MRDDAPSLTARGVAIVRSMLDRPCSPAGDPDADRRLAQHLLAGIERSGLGHERRRGREFAVWMTARTRFFDDAVVGALADDITQIVILGAGYDGRALRFRTPGVTFFEVDHPATQGDKLASLAEIGASTDGIAFVAADFTEPGLAGALEEAGHDASLRSLFICEGVLRYLPEDAFRGLLRTSAERAAPGSRFAASVSTRERDAAGEADRLAHAEREERLAASGEPVLTVPERAVAFEWLVEAGWTLRGFDDVGAAPNSRPGRLLVRAER
jgi:methyltransferase (TIGR00027 family)